jgi:hypothetical protein
MAVNNHGNKLYNIPPKVQGSSPVEGENSKQKALLHPY